MTTKSHARRANRTDRLTRQGVFQALFQRGRRVERPSLLVLWRKWGGPSQVGFAVSRRVGGAVRRNRAKRRLREAYRGISHHLPAGLQLVCVAKEAAEEVPFYTLQREMQEALAAVTRYLRARTAP